MEARDERGPSSSDKDTVLVADKLTRHYSVKRSMFTEGTVKALNGVSFSLERGKTLAVVGESGCGKSTLARQLTMIEAPTSGRLLIDGRGRGRTRTARRSPSCGSACRWCSRIRLLR